MAGKLRYYYGCMNSLKSGTLLTKAHQFKEAGCEVICLKPSFDTREKGVIHSRAISSSQPCYVFDKNKDLFKFIYSIMGQLLREGKDIYRVVVFVDEVSFITKEQVQQLWKLTRCPYNVNVFTYGLKNTYQNTLFESAEELLIVADTVEEIKSMCSVCTNKATTHLRYVNDKPVFTGEDCIVGDVAGEERYVSVCQECWHRVHNESHNVGIDVGDFESKTINEPISSAQRAK